MDGSSESGATLESAEAVEAGLPCEIELKLLASSRAIAQVRGASIIAQHSRTKGATRRLDAVYYDTADRLLFSHGVTLRVRRSGKSFVQTVKRAAASGDPIVRNEWEAPVETMAPDLTRLPRAEIGSPFDNLADADLAPVFEAKVRRHLKTIELPDAVIEMAFDDGVIEARGRSECVSEIELELKSGDAAALYEFGMSLLDVAPLQIGTSSKSARGYALAFDASPAAAKAMPAGLSAEDTLDEAIAKLLRSCQRQIMGNLAIIAGGRDPDGVHQMRVALRRLRTAISILRKDAPSLDAINAEARRLAQTLGPARSWDVFMTETLLDIGSADLPEIGLDGLRGVAEPLRAKSYVAVREAFADPSCARFLLALGRLIERRSWRNDISSDRLAIMAEPATAFADRALSRINRKAIRQGRQFRRLAPKARHELRLTLKKLRYTAEFFLPLYAGQAPAQKYLKRLSRLQDALGADNDVTTTRPLLHDIERSTAAPDVHRAVGAIVGWQGYHQLEAAKTLAKGWRDFKLATPFWRD